MDRLVFVSNRVERVNDSQPMAGGLAAAVAQTLHRTDGPWFGRSGEVVDACAEQPGQPTRPAPKIDGRVEHATVPLASEEYDRLHCGLANRALGPLLCSRLDLVSFRHEDPAAYNHVTAKFARALAPLLRLNDVAASTERFRRSLSTSTGAFLSMGSAA